MGVTVPYLVYTRFVHILKGANGCEERLEEDYIGKAKESPMFLALSFHEGEEELYRCEIGCWGCGGIRVPRIGLYLV